MKIEVENAQQNEQVDWSKNPQLVVNYTEPTEPLIVLCIDTQHGDTFKGVVLSKTTSIGIHLVGKEHTDFWRKSFKPFHGKITISND
jgi:hypothetical protein